MESSIPIGIPGLEIDEVAVREEIVRLEAHSTHSEAACPDCGTVSSQVHSWYQRHPKDLPCMGETVQFVLSVRRFFCIEKTCQRRTFVEPMNPWLARYARRTSRLNAILQLLALAMGGELGSRLSKRLSMGI